MGMFLSKTHEISIGYILEVLSSTVPTLNNVKYLPINNNNYFYIRN